MSDELTKEEIRAIVASEKPGFEIENEDDNVPETSAMADNANIQGDAPDLEFLLKKFLPEGSIESSSNSAARPATQDSSMATKKSRIVKVRPAGTHAADAEGTGSRKVIVVSAKSKKIVAEQG